MALEKSPGNPQLLGVKARHYLTRAKNELCPEMAAIYETMITDLGDKNPKETSYASEYATAFRNLAAYCLSQSDKANAKVYFGKYLELDPDNAKIREIYDSL